MENKFTLTKGNFVRNPNDKGKHKIYKFLVFYENIYNFIIRQIRTNLDLISVVEEIELKYKEAILLDQDFTLLHANETICNRPYSLRGQAIMNVIKDAFKMYNSSDDILLHSTTSTNLTMDNDIKLENISADLLNKFLAVS